jgi:ribosomal protein L37AE/L43A
MSLWEHRLHADLEQEVTCPWCDGRIVVAVGRWECQECGADGLAEHDGGEMVVQRDERGLRTIWRPW